MSRWFRMYDELLDDPKVQRLSGDDFKAWVNILCLASRKDGTLPPLADIGFALRLDAKKADSVVSRLVSAGLLDADGDCFTPHGWNSRQYKSDVSTDRVKQFRKRKKDVAGNGDETFHETPPDTEADTETEEDPPSPPAGNGKVYAFQGRIARLNRRDYDDWRERFSAIPDFDAELAALDSWLSAQPAAKQKNWFGSAAPWLNKRHQEAIERTSPRAKDPMENFIA